MAIKDGCSRAQVLLNYSVKEIYEWMIYEKIHGDILLHRRLDILFARSDWLYAESNRNRKKRAKKFKVKDFLMNWDTEKGKRKKKSWTELYKIMRGISE